MRTTALIAAMLLAFVAAPAAILAFHTAPAPVPVSPAARKLLDYVNAKELDGVDCRAVHRRVICINGAGADGSSLAAALGQYPDPGTCHTRRRRTVCVLRGL
jgi:hypothetical protein